MPDHAPRQSYRATSNTVVYWVVVGLVVFFVRPFIPPVVNPKLAGSHSGFIRQAASQKIEWQDMSPDIFAQARASGKPIFLMIGTEWSDLTQDFDNRVFNSADVAERLNRDFISVRLDAQRSRAWSSAFLQLVRAQQGWEPHNQVLFLSASGQILRMIDVAPNTQAMNDVRFIGILDEVRFPTLESGQTIEATRQAGEHQALVGGYDQAVPDPVGYRDRVLAELKPSSPGFDVGKTQVLPARDYVFLTAAGESETVREQIHTLLARPAFSWLDGSFFRSSRDYAWYRVTLSESAGRNADMLEVLGSLTQDQPESLDRAVADRVFESLVDRFVAKGQFYSASYAKLGPAKRSTRYSVPLSKARRLFGPNAGRAVQVMGLDPIKNPLMVPTFQVWPPSNDEYEAMEKYMAAINDSADLTPATMAGSSSLDVGSRVATALLRYAGLTGREDYLNKALDVAAYAQTALVGDNDVRHSLEQGAEAPYLGDYLNFAEMQLTLYRVSGDFAALAVGRRLFDRSRFLFESSSPGVVMNAKFPDYGDLADLFSTPKLVDDDLPATCAQMALLLRSFAAVENDPAKRAAMRQRSDVILSTMAPAAKQIARQAGSFYLAATYARADATVFCVGPDSVEKARRWDWISNSSLAFPAFAGVRPDLQARGPGYYVDISGQALGPMSYADAKSRVAQCRYSALRP